MKEIFVKLKNLSLITIVSSLIIGIVLLIKPDETVKFISILCGAVMIALGIGSWITYFAKHKMALLQIMGTISIIVGIVVCAKYKSIISIILFIFGLFILVSGVVDLFTSISAKRFGMSVWIVSLLLSLVTIVLGLLVVVNPFSSMIVLVRILGVGLLAYAIVDLIAFIEIKKKFAQVENAIEQEINSNEIDVEGKDVD